jgi:hypothetical protein
VKYGPRETLRQAQYKQKTAQVVARDKKGAGRKRNGVSNPRKGAVFIFASHMFHMEHRAL